MKKIRPPVKAIKQIKEYCEKTQCGKCNYGQVDNIYQYTHCTLIETLPWEWETQGEENENNISKKAGKEK